MLIMPVSAYLPTTFKDAINILVNLNARFAIIDMSSPKKDYVKSIRKLQKIAVVKELLINLVLLARSGFTLSMESVNNPISSDVWKRIIRASASIALQVHT